MTSRLELRRRRQLGGAVLQFLQAECPEAAKIYMQDEASKGVFLTIPTEPDQLFKKWSATVRIQNKVDESEKKIAHLQEQLRLFECASKFDPRAKSFPSAPPATILTGHRQAVNRLAFHPLVLLLASCSDDGLVMIWDYGDGGNLIKVLRGHTAEVHDVDFDSTGKLLATCSADTSVKLWDCSRFECLRTLNGHDLPVSGVRFLPGGEKLLSCSKDESIRLWETATGYCFKTFSGQPDWIRCVAVAPHRDYFASAGTDHMIYFWHVEESEPLTQFTAHDHVIESIAFANPLMLEHLNQKKKAPAALNPIQRRRKSTASVEGVDSTGKAVDTPAILEKVGPVLFSASRDNTIKMWNVMEGVCLGRFDGHLNWVKEISIHPSGLSLASCSDDRSIKIWDVFTGECELTLYQAHRQFINCCRFGVKSPVLATSSSDTDIRIWALTGRPQESIDLQHSDKSSSPQNSISLSSSIEHNHVQAPSTQTST